MTMAFSKCEEVDACEEDSTMIFIIDAQRLHAVMGHLSGSPGSNITLDPTLTIGSDARGSLDNFLHG